VCNLAAVQAAEELHARSKGYLTSVKGGREGEREREREGDDDDVFYLFLQKQNIALRHIPFGYSPPRNKETPVMMLPL
jgi:hypothetical protein